MKQSILEYIKLIVDYPNSVHIKEEDCSEYIKLSIYVENCDVGKVIGKDGNMINSIKMFIYGCRSKTFKLQVFDINEKD
jgi:predicted RNA-binding protein YlqC (UPF0109 family)